MNPPTTLAAAPRRKRIRWFWLRWLAFSLLLLLFLTGILGYFLNRLGLPEFIKQRVVARFRSQGWEVQFSRLRLRWYRGLVVDHLQLQPTNEAAGPIIFVEEAQVPLNRHAFRRLGIEAVAMQVHNGRLFWPLGTKQGQRRTTVLNNLESRLYFRPGDRWELDFLRGTYRGVQLELSGVLTNASAVRSWRIRPGVDATEGRLKDWLSSLESVRDQLHLGGQPVLAMEFRGDARDFASLDVTVRSEVSRLDSPWLSGAHLLVSAQLDLAGYSNQIAGIEARLTADGLSNRWGSLHGLRADLKLDHEWSAPVWTNWTLALEASQADTPWGEAKRLSLTAHARPDALRPLLREAAVEIKAAAITGGWGRATNAQLLVAGSTPQTNWLPASIRAELNLQEAQSRWGSTREAELKLRGSCPSNHRLLDTNATWLDRLAVIPLELDATLRGLSVVGLDTSQVALSSHWASPRWHFVVGAGLPDGRFDATGELDTLSQVLSFCATNHFDWKALTPVLGTNFERRLAETTYEAPPRVEACGRVRLPAWTNRQPDWCGQVLPTLAVSGRADLGKSAWRGLTFEGIRTSFSFTNSCLYLPTLHLERPEGQLEADVELATDTGEYQVRLRSTLDPKMIRPLFAEDREQRAFDVVRFSAPPRIQAEIAGCLTNWGKLHAAARVAITNFAVNGQEASGCLAHVVYTNRYFSILAPQLERGEERAVADGLGIDLTKRRFYVTNAFGNLDPHVFIRAINAETARDLEPYQFATPPTIRVSGIIGLVGRDHAEDLRFRVEGGAFRWQCFNLEALSGEVHVLGETARLTNVLGEFYGGSITGNSWFEWSGTNGTRFAFDTTVTNANLGALLTDVSSRTNRVEGTLEGRLVITSANTLWPLSWQGYGRVDLRNGLVWDIPLFGIFSSVLNSLIPGLGNSRARQGVAQFAITNSVIYTRDLDIRATAMRMHFDGQVGFDQTVDGRMEAELLRDTPAVGLFVSKVFWPFTKLFEYKVTGTLDQPKAEPLYLLPKVLLLPFQPLRLFKDILSSEGEKPPAQSPRK